VCALACVHMHACICSECCICIRERSMLLFAWCLAIWACLARRPQIKLQSCLGSCFTWRCIIRQLWAWMFVPVGCKLLHLPARWMDPCGGQKTASCESIYGYDSSPAVSGRWLSASCDLSSSHLQDTHILVSGIAGAHLFTLWWTYIVGECQFCNVGCCTFQHKSL
jgi:hypothetical protein